MKQAVTAWYVPVKRAPVVAVIVQKAVAVPAAVVKWRKPLQKERLFYVSLKCISYICKPDMIRRFVILPFFCSIFICCKQPADSVHAEKSMIVPIHADTVSSLGTDIDCIVQDKYGDYWFASNNSGVYCYKGGILLHYSVKQGLCSNFVQKIQMDESGSLWFSTRDGFCRFDGNKFEDFTAEIINAKYTSLNYVKGGLFFPHQNGICFYNGKTFSNFKIQPENFIQSESDANRPYAVYSVIADNNSNIWFGTQDKGVCRYNGLVYTWYTDHGLDKAAVRAVFQDSKGNLWFGNNGAGLFCWDGRSLKNLTENFDLSNADFPEKITDKPGTLARVWAINEDKDGRLWIGTIDAGLWSYDGNMLKNYSVKDGLPGNAVWYIYKDQQGELQFITDGNTVSKFEGKFFRKVNFQ